MQILITTYECGHRDSATSHPRASKGKTITKRETSELRCPRCAEPVVEFDRSLFRFVLFNPVFRAALAVAKELDRA